MDMRPETAGGWRLWYREAPVLVLALATLPAAAQIAPLTYQNLFFDQASNAHTGDYLAANAGLIYTDNASIGANGPSDTLAEVGLVGNTSQDTQHLQYHLGSDIALVRYLHGSYPTEPTGYFDGSAAAKIVPGFFSWYVRDTYTQLEINPFAPVTPDNLENVNYLTTGPRLTLRPTLRTAVILEGVYSYIASHPVSSSSQYVNIGNHSYGGHLRIERAFSSTASLYAKGRYEKVDFIDQAENHNFTVEEGSLGYNLVDARTDLDLSGGYTRVRAYRVPISVQSIIGIVEKPETRTFGGANWGISLSRLITPAQRVAVFASQQLVDPAQAFQFGFDSAVPTIAPGQLAVGEAFINRSFGADWRVLGPRTSLDVAVLDMRQRFELTPRLNRDLKDASALLGRQLGAVLNWDIGVRFERQGLTSARSVNVTQELTSLRWRIGDRLGLRFIYTHSTFAGIQDNQIAALLSYALIGAVQQGREWATPPTLQPISPASTQLPPVR